MGVGLLYLIPGIVSILGALGTLFIRGVNRVTRLYFVRAIVFAGIAIVLYSLMFFPATSQMFIFNLFFVVTALLCAPFYLLFVKSLTDRSGVNPEDRWVFIPSVVVILIAICLGVLTSPDEQRLYMQDVVGGRGRFGGGGDASYNFLAIFNYYVCNAFIFIEASATLVYSFVRYHKYRRLLLDYYSNTDSSDIRACRNVLLVSGAASVLAVVLILNPHYNRPGAFPDVLITVSVLLVQCFVCHSASNMKYTAEELRTMLKKTSGPQPAVMPESADAVTLAAADPVDMFKDINDVLRRVMEEERAYLDPDVTLVSLAAKVGTNRTYLSRVIHTNYGLSFSDYVNGYRIRHALTFMEDDPDKTMKEVSEQSGFNNAASFIRQFSRVTGKKPSEWDSSKQGG